MAILRAIANALPTTRRMACHADTCAFGCAAVGGDDMRHYVICPAFSPTESDEACRYPHGALSVSRLSGDDRGALSRSEVAGLIVSIGLLPMRVAPASCTAMLCTRCLYCPRPVPSDSRPPCAAGHFPRWPCRAPPRRCRCVGSVFVAQSGVPDRRLELEALRRLPCTLRCRAGGVHVTPG